MSFLAAKVNIDFDKTKLAKLNNDAINKALDKAGRDVLLETNKKYTPKDTGLTIFSSMDEFDKKTGHDANKNKVELIYNTPYSERLYTNSQFNFKNKRRGEWFEPVIPDIEKIVVKRLEDEYQKIGG